MFFDFLLRMCDSSPFGFDSQTCFNSPEDFFFPHFLFFSVLHVFLDYSHYYARVSFLTLAQTKIATLFRLLTGSCQTLKTKQRCQRQFPRERRTALVFCFSKTQRMVCFSQENVTVGASSKMFKRKYTVVLLNGQWNIYFIFYLNWIRAPQNTLMPALYEPNRWTLPCWTSDRSQILFKQYSFSSICFTAAFLICFHSVTFFTWISRLWCILPHLLRAPLWLVHQLHRGSETGWPWPLCTISQQMLGSPVRRPGWGMPSMSQILPQVFRSWKKPLPELQPETSPAQWVKYGLHRTNWWILWSLHVLESSSGIYGLFE